MKTMNKLIGMTVILLFTVSCKAQENVINVSISNTGSKNIDDYLLGFNAPLMQGPSMDDPQFIEAIKGLYPSVLRYPGGTVANQWDWVKGWTTSYDFKHLAVNRYRLEEFKKAIDATKAMPVYVLNMCTSTLDSQVMMLRHAQELGLPVKLLELGNEFYNPLKINIATFPTASDYAMEANKWIERLKKEFPGIEIAVVGRSEKDEGLKNMLEGKEQDERMKNWNSQLFASIKNADAATFHLYSGNGLNAIKSNKKKVKHTRKSEYTDEERSVFQEAFESPGAIKGVLGVPFNRVKQFVDNDVDMVPGNLKIWVTEFNLFEKNGIVAGTWTHGLYTTTLTLLLAEANKTEMALLHTLAGDVQFASIFNNEKAFASNLKKPATVKNSYSVTGYALGQVMKAAQKMNKISPLAFDNSLGVTTNITSYNSLFGYQFSNNTQSNYILVNLSPKRISINLKNLDLKNASYVLMKGDPLKQIVTVSDLEIEKGNIQGDKIFIKPFSILTINSQNQ